MDGTAPNLPILVNAFPRNSGVRGVPGSLGALFVEI